MVRVWFVVFLSMCFTLIASALWYMSAMNDEVRRDKAIDDPVLANIEHISLYRDVLKEKGKSAAAEYLNTLSPDIYGN